MSEIAQEQGSRFEAAARRQVAGGGNVIADPLSWVRSGLGATTTLLASAIVFGFLVRVIAAVTLTPHVDEPSSVLAAHMVAERGLPILPSGTPYFQGTTLSYLLQPFVWLGLGEIHHLPLMRMVLVLAGTVAIWLSYRLARAITGSASVGAITAMLVAIDPVSVQWSAHVRMYGLLQALTFALAWAYIRLLQGHTGWRQIGIVVGLFWLAVFTHVGASLLGAAMALAAVLVYRRDVIRQWRLLVTLGASALASVTLLTINRVLGTANEPVQSSGSSSFKFVGDNLLAPLASIKAIPTDDVFQRITAGITLYWLIPGLIVAVSAIIGARHLLRTHADDRDMRIAVLTLMSFYWLPLLLVIGFTISPEVRYLLHMHLLGYIFVAVLAVEVLQRAARERRQEGGATRTIPWYGVIAAVLVAIGASLLWRLDNPVHQPDYNAAMAYVAEHHQPGEPVIVTLPPVGYLSVDETERDDVYFLAGSEGWTRADRYTRWAEDGRLIDYWIGADSIVSTRTLADILDDHPNAWIIADNGRLDHDWVNEEAITRVIRETMYPAHRSEGGAVVYRTTPAELQVPESDATEVRPVSASDVGAGTEDANPCETTEGRALRACARNVLTP